MADIDVEKVLAALNLSEKVDLLAGEIPVCFNINAQPLRQTPAILNIDNY
jgi:hypothetical protein